MNVTLATFVGLGFCPKEGKRDSASKEKKKMEEDLRAGVG